MRGQYAGLTIVRFPFEKQRRPEVCSLHFLVMAPTKSTKGKEILRTIISPQGKAPMTAKPGKRSTIKRQRDASSLVEGGALPGVQKIKSALRQTRRLLAKVRESASFGRS